MKRFQILLIRGLLLRCPLCGRGKLFSSWFRMHKQCGVCQETFEREPGYFLGSIYFNYGITSLIVAVAYPLFMFNKILEDRTLQAAALAFVLLFPLWFFRYARSIWLAFDQYADPRTGEQG